MIKQMIQSVLILTLGIGSSIASVSIAEAQQVFRRIIPAPVKPIFLNIIKSSEWQAYSTDNEIVLSTKVLKQVNRSQLAMVIGHEYAHIVNRDYFYTTPNSRSENKADDLGNWYAQQKGYNPCQNRKFYDKLKHLYGNGGDSGDVHDSFQTRKERLDRLCHRRK